MRPVFQKILRWFGKFCLWFFIVSVVLTLLFRFLPVFYTPLMLQRSLEYAWNGKSVPFQKEWVSMDEISDNLALAVVCAEDQNFEEHNGFDFDAIEKAIEENKKRRKKGRTIHGASTISQQTAKNLFLLPTRSLWRKGLEVYFTILIETLWSKERIMEVYLNEIEMGEGIYGAQAAAKAYFGKNAKDLRPSEAALIAAVLPNPRKWSPNDPTGYISKRQRWIMRQMNAWEGNKDF
jgi:monofunctional glycosyltransferase